MGGKTLVKNTLVVGIILLFIVSAVSPMVIGLKSDTVDVEKDEFLDNLAFYYYDEYDSSKLEDYKEYFQRDSSEIADLEEITIPVESPQTSVSSGPMDSPWPMKCHDNRHTGKSPYGTASLNVNEKWRFGAGWIEGSPVIDNNGTIYFGCFNYYLYAIYPNATLKWKCQTGGRISDGPTLAEDGTIYVGSWDNKLWAFYSNNGTVKWKFNALDTIASSPAIAEDGTIYFGTMGNGYRIYAVNPNGTEKWQYQTGYKITCDPAIGDDGTIYIGSGDTYLYAMNPNGTLKWRFKTDDIIQGSASIAEDGTVYIGSFDDYLYALYPNNGTMKWKCKVGKGTETNPSIAGDGTIYVGGSELYAIYPNGTMRWSFNMGPERHVAESSPAIFADGTIYVGTNINSVDGGEIIAVNPDGTEKWRKKISPSGWVDSSPCIGEDGTVYIGSNIGIGGGYLYAFEPDNSNQPPDAPDIDGPPSGKAGNSYKYTFSALDPNGNPASLYIEWGDGSIEEWIGPYFSGQEIELSHTWPEKDTYTIRCKAKDVYDEESDWGYLEVTMPMNQQTQNWWFLQFLQNHPRMFPMLQRLFSFTIFNRLLGM